MPRSFKPLVLNVTRSNQTRQFVLDSGSKFTVGQSGKNDLILYGTDYPRRHILFAQKNGTFQINIKPFIDGEVTMDGSTLKIVDLVKHDVLPRKKDVYVLKLIPDKLGYLNVGDTKIDFSFQHIEKSRPTIAVHHPAYSWTRATFKSMSSDLLFKFIFLTLFVVNVIMIYTLKDYKISVNKKFNIEKMPERLAKFIIKPPEELLSNVSSTSGLASDGDKKEVKEPAHKSDNNQPNSNHRSTSPFSSSERRGNPAASAGLLGLIGSTGSISGKASSIVDVLVDKGLVTQLDDILGGTNLKVGKNNTKDKIDPLDQLIGSGGTGGINNFLDAMTETAPIPQVTLTKQAQVELVRPQKLTGSSEAMGQRTEQSIMNVVLARQGQIQYIYEKYLKKNPNLRGKISIEFTIAANGFVKSARVIESTVDQPQFERELLALIQRLKFDAIASGEVTTIFPFQFSKLN